MNASITTQDSTTIETDILRIRTYPYHNDAGVAKVWEAGACLAEYIMYNPHLICDRNVVELGAGVGGRSLYVRPVIGGMAKCVSLLRQSTSN